MSNIYQFKVQGLTNGEIDFSNFKGKKIMIVNLASKCGFTSQYQQLQELHEQSGDKIQIIGFPCNDFGGQEPGSADEIQNFCSTNYGVTFPLATKIAILGEEPHPIYQWLTQKDKNSVADSEVKWNFHKYLLDEEGQLVKDLPSAVSPIDETVLDWVMN
ncbi:MAG: glutathione peroxidase [Polaribacter sp.]|jgi:glutathione peroxidase